MCSIVLRRENIISDKWYIIRVLDKYCVFRVEDKQKTVVSLKYGAE